MVLEYVDTEAEVNTHSTTLGGRKTIKDRSPVSRGQTTRYPWLGM